MSALRLNSNDMQLTQPSFLDARCGELVSCNLQNHLCIIGVHVTICFFVVPGPQSKAAHMLSIAYTLPLSWDPDPIVNVLQKVLRFEDFCSWEEVELVSEQNPYPMFSLLQQHCVFPSTIFILTQLFDYLMAPCLSGDCTSVMQNTANDYIEEKMII